ncbi:MAG: ubiquitin-like domain-containing protein, partial [Actinomycetota bacterium]|nr:ubiquitin-like domain-containing protein [Actinomycetota bacterium]
MRKRVALIALAAVTALAGVGGSVAYAGLHKTVTVSVDGKVWHVSTFHRTVGDVLTSQGITLDRHDAVAPSLTTAVNKGTRIAVRYGRELTLTVDGTPQTYWVAATSVEAALEQIGRRFLAADLSVSRSAPIGRTGLDVDVATEKNVVVVAGA